MVLVKVKKKSEICGDLARGIELRITNIIRSGVSSKPEEAQRGVSTLLRGDRGCGIKILLQTKAEGITQSDGSAECTNSARGLWASGGDGSLRQGFHKNMKSNRDLAAKAGSDSEGAGGVDETLDNVSGPVRADLRSGRNEFIVVEKLGDMRHILISDMGEDEAGLRRVQSGCQVQEEVLDEDKEGDVARGVGRFVIGKTEIKPVMDATAVSAARRLCNGCSHGSMAKVAKVKVKAGPMR